MTQKENKMIRKIGILVFFCIVGCSSISYALDIESNAFKNGKYIPTKYTCQGQDLSPFLQWSDIPSQTKSFALICDDPDASFGTWVHWVVYNIPLDVVFFNENASSLNDTIIQGINDFKRVGYAGPCPPKGKPHRYFFKLYALDAVLELEQGATKKELIEAMSGHIIAQAKLIGLYKRK